MGGGGGGQGVSEPMTGEDGTRVSCLPVRCCQGCWSFSSWSLGKLIRGGAPISTTAWSPGQQGQRTRTPDTQIEWLAIGCLQVSSQGRRGLPVNVQAGEPGLA